MKYFTPEIIISLYLTLICVINIVKLLTTKDHFEVTEFLRNLDKNELIRLGEALGLSYSKLKKMEPLCEEMVDAWLKQEEDVIEQSGEPSWKSLKAALKKIGQTGLIRTIITDTLGRLASCSYNS